MVETILRSPNRVQPAETRLLVNFEPERTI